MYTDNVEVQNHHSARHYSEAIQKYIKKEKSLGKLIGPFESPHFTLWYHISSLTMRPKSYCNERSIKVDLSYGGMNAHIVKNCIDG